MRSEYMLDLLSYVSRSRCEPWFGNPFVSVPFRSAPLRSVVRCRSRSGTLLWSMVLLQHALSNGFGAPQMVRSEEGPERIVLLLPYLGKVQALLLLDIDCCRAGQDRGQGRIGLGGISDWLLLLVE